MADWKSSQEFLKEFYASPIVNEDTIPAKIKRIFLPKSRKASALKELAGDLSGEGRAGDVILDNDMFEMDTEIWKKQEKRRLSVRTRVSLFLLLVAIPLTIAVGFYVMDVAAVGTVFEKIFGPRKYYFISLVIIIYSLLPFFMVFEGRKPQVRELVVLATMVALATAGRAAFFMIPSFKPIIAIVIISAIAFGGEAGFLVGAMTMVVSNFLFGQGPWTPWQMFAMGFIGFLSGILYRIGLLPTKRLSYIWIPCDGVHLWRNHESGGPLYERVRFYMGRTACNLYFRYSGGSCSCQFYIYLSVDWSKAIVGKAAADKNKI